MSITLAEAKVGMADKVDQQIIDMFRRSSLLLDALTFDNAISPGTGGSTLTYGYIQLKTPSTAAVRAINSEYTPGEAKRVEKTAKAEIMGGSFEVDRVLQNTSGAVDELAFQAEQKIKATANFFHNKAINDTTSGLAKALEGTENEFTSAVDLTTSANMDNNYSAFLDELDTVISAVDGKPSMLLMNREMLSKLRSAARRAGYYTRSEDAFGRTVEAYNDIPLMDVGGYYNGTKTVDVIPTSTPSATAEGTTAIYAVALGLDAFHGISPVGNNVINTYMPDMTAPGAVKKGEVELVAGTVLKNTLKAAVLKGIKIKPKKE
jgi:hypothetical protein|nr:MAG TPA: major capsid protein [Caudoviricetes sp.]